MAYNSLHCLITVIAKGLILLPSLHWDGKFALTSGPYCVNKNDIMNGYTVS